MKPATLQFRWHRRRHAPWLRTVVDHFICLHEPEQFYAVGQFYEHFSQVADEDFIDLLQRAWHLPVRTSSPVDSTWNGSEREVTVNEANLASSR